MSVIIAGRFQQQSEVEDGIEELLRAGFGREQISSFYVNPPGMHDNYPMGGDNDRSVGAHESDKRVARGAAAGAAIGVAATPFLGPVGAVTGGLLGAHVGGLVGGLSEMKEQGETGEDGEEADNVDPLRHAGMMVAIAIDGNDQEERAISLLQSLGAVDIERSDGTITDGDWIDFDPTSLPHLVHHSSDRSRTTEPNRRA